LTAAERGIRSMRGRRDGGDGLPRRFAPRNDGEGAALAVRRGNPYSDARRAVKGHDDKDEKRRLSDSSAAWLVKKVPLRTFLTAPAVGYFAGGKITCSQKTAAAVFWCDGASDSRRACVARQRMSHGAACGADRRSAAVLLYPNRSICFGSEEDEQRNEQALPPCGGARDTELARTKLPCSSVFLHRSTVF